MSIATDNHIDDQKTQVKNVSRTIVSLAAVAAALTAIYVYLGWRFQYWQATAVAVMLGLMVGVCLISLYLVRHNRLRAGIWLLIVMIWVGFPATSLFIANVDLIVAISLILLTFIIAIQTLPTQALKKIIPAAFLSAAVTLMIDFLPLDYRLALPVLNIYFGIATTLIAIIFTYFVVRGFGRFSLRTKLVAAFAVVLAVSLGSLTFIVTAALRVSLIEETGGRLQTLAESQADIVEDRLTQQVNALSALALQSSVRDRLAIANASLTTSTDALIEAEDRWLTADDNDPFIQARLTNQLAQDLRDFQAVFPEHLELFVTNVSGELVAASQRPRHYVYANESWWQAAFADGDGAIFLGQPEKNDADLWVLPIALPVYATADGEVIGILHANFDAAELQTVLLEEQTDLLGIGEIYLPSGEEFEMEAGTLKIEDAEFDFNVLAAFADPNISYIQTPYDDVPSLISQAMIGNAAVNPAVAALDWRIVIHQTEATALAFSETQERNLTLVVLTAGFVGTVVALGLSSILLQPIEVLISTTKQIRAGDMSARAVVTTGDELQLMADDLNLTLDELNQRNRDIEVSGNLSRSIAATLDPGQLAHTVVTQIQAAFNYYQVTLYLWHESEQQLVATAVAIPNEGEQAETLQPTEWVARVWQQQTVILIPDVSQEPLWESEPTRPHTKAAAAIPIQSGTQILGVLVLQQNVVDGITEADIVVLRPITNQLGSALQNVRQIEQIIETQQRFALAVAGTNDGIWEWDIASNQVYFSPRWKAMIGYAEDEISNDFAEFEQRLHPDDHDHMMQAIADYMEGRVDTYEYETRLQHKDGSYRWILVRGTLERDEDGNPKRMAGSHSDITRRKQSEAVLAKQANTLTAVVEVSTAAATILQTGQLLQEVVDLTQDRFSLYHAHIFLLDQDENMLVLTAGAGEIGQQMVAEGRHISLDAQESLVAASARERQGAIRNYESGHEGFMPHPLLADTRAELAVPIVLGETLLGVLDVRSDKANFFDTTDIQSFMSLAAQIAIAWQNATSFTQAEQAIERLDTLTRRLTRSGWQDFTVQAADHLTYGYAQGKTSAVLDNEQEDLASDTKLVQPLQIRGEKIGALTLSEPEELADGASDIMATVAERLSIHLDNLRLEEQTRKRTEELAVINEVAQTVAQQTQQKEMLEFVLEQIRRILSVDAYFVALYDSQAHLVAYPYLYDNNQVYQIEPEPVDSNSNIAKVLQSGEPILISWTQDEANELAQSNDFPSFGDTKQIPASLMFVPLFVGQKVLGVMSAQTYQVNAYNQDSVDLLVGIANHVALSLENTRLLQNSQRTAEREQVLRELSTTINTSFDAESVLRTAAREIGRALDLETYVYLVDDQSQSSKGNGSAN